MDKIIFIGNDLFASKLLNEFLNLKINFIYVITNVDKKKGRGQKVIENEISKIASKNKIPVYKTSNINENENELFIKNLNPNIILMSGYGKKINNNIFNIPKYGILNIHPSILPKLKGPTPIQSSILYGYNETGISIIKINEKLDGGKIIYSEKCNIDENENFLSLTNKLIDIAKNCILNILLTIKTEQINNYSINTDIIESSTQKFNKNFYKINWNDSAININRKIRAFFGIKKFSFKIRNIEFKIIESEVIKYNNANEPGIILEINKNEIIISTGLDALKIVKLQICSKKENYIKNIFNSIKFLIKKNDKII